MFLTGGHPYGPGAREVWATAYSSALAAGMSAADALEAADLGAKTFLLRIDLYEEYRSWSFDLKDALREVDRANVQLRKNAHNIARSEDRLAAATDDKKCARYQREIEDATKRRKLQQAELDRAQTRLDEVEARKPTWETPND